MSKLKVFVSSVQKELQNERIAVSEIITTDPFLASHCQPVLYEWEPATPEDAVSGCLKCVDQSDIYVIVVGNEYGRYHEEFSITHQEYRRARQNGIPILVYLKGHDDGQREHDVNEKLLTQIREDGHKYKRFSNYRELKAEVRASLVKILKDHYGFEPSSDENEIAEQTIEAASPFGSIQTKVPWGDLNLDLSRELVSNIQGLSKERLDETTVRQALLARGLLWHDAVASQDYATTAGVALLSEDPTIALPQCRILADAFRGVDRTSRPSDQEDISTPMPKAIERAIEFVQRNTRHPMRVVGLNRIQLDEYPVEALREALVNAVAHRKYELEGHKIFLTVFIDRVVVASPGLPPKPITLAKLRSGNYRPCSRNPLIAQNLGFFQRIEERGSGMTRMRDEMLDHGLDQPRLATKSGFFEVILPGPGDNLERLKVRADSVGQLVSPAVEARLNDRQKEMVALLVAGEQLTSRRCEQEFQVTRDTANRDFKLLISLGLAEARGRGRSRHYVLKGVV